MSSPTDEAWPASDFDIAFLQSMVEDAVRDGLTEDEARLRVPDQLGQVMERRQEQISDHLINDRQEMLQAHRRTAVKFRRRLRRTWGSAFDEMLAFVIFAEQVGARFNSTHRPYAVTSNNVLFEALTGLQARACRVAFEVHALLSEGFPKGALARQRTLHEISVIGGVLRRFGENGETSDIAERYLLHEHIANYSDACRYQEDCERLGLLPFAPEEMTQMMERRDEVVGKFGASMKRPYGWAAHALGKKEPKFIDLEEAADLDHLRGYYRLASHEVHPDAKGGRLNLHVVGDQSILVSGRIDSGLAEPAHLSAISLLQVTQTLTLSPQVRSIEDLIIARILQQHVDHLSDTLQSAAQVAAANRDSRGSVNLRDNDRGGVAPNQSDQSGLSLD